MPEKGYMTPKEATDELGVHDETIRRYIKRGVFQDVVIRGMLKLR
jgi:excisionase family DNA binding protein